MNAVDTNHPCSCIRWLAGTRRCDADEKCEHLSRIWFNGCRSATRIVGEQLMAASIPGSPFRPLQSRSCKLPMILWDPNNLDSELDSADGRLNWGNSFWDQGRSLAIWLKAWLVERPEPEPKWPNDSWMRKRLGLMLAK